MRDVLDQVWAWAAAGRPCGLATVVRTWGSAPRRVGASMAVGDDGAVVGSVSGGCVEGAVHEVALEVLRTGEPRLETYGVPDDDAFAVGLTCGGTLQVLVERVDAASAPGLAEVRARVAARRAVALATTLESPPGGPPAGRHLVVGADGALLAGAGGGAGVAGGGLGDPALARAVAAAAGELLERGRDGVVRTGPTGSVAVFVESFAPPPVMYVYGAVDFTGALVRAAKLLGHHVVVCDARPVFAAAARFPDADEVVVAWPHEHLAAAVAAGAVDERSVVCVLTHDPRFDVPLLEVALATRAAYVGAMGSRATHEERTAQLRGRGVTEEALARLSSPIGLDLGGRSPEETAVPIVAEVVATTWGGTGRRLRDLRGPIHR